MWTCRAWTAWKSRAGCDARPGGDIVLIAMTGWSRNEDRTAAMLGGFDHFLAKPVNLDELFALLPATPR